MNQQYKSMRITLIYDSYSRDRKPLLKIKRELERSGALCYLIPLQEALEHSIAFKPDAILLGNPDLYIGESITLLSNRLHVFSLPTEQGILKPELLIERIIGGHNKNQTFFEPPNLNLITTFFLWGEYQKKTLQAAGIDPKKLFVSGNVRFDNIQSSNATRDARRVGIALETEITKNLAYDLWALDGLPSAYGSFCDYYTLDIHVLNAQIKVIKRLLADGYHVVIRPRTADRNTDYSFLGNVEVDLTDSPAHLLTTCSFIITGQSTIGAEAYFYDAKVITVLNLVDPRIITDVMRNYLTFQHPNAPKSVDEICGIISGSIPYKSVAELKETIRYYLGIVDSKTRPEVLIAHEILRKLMENNSFNDQTNSAAARRIEIKLAAKYYGLIGMMVRNRHNYYGRALAAVLFVVKALRRRLSVRNGN